MGRKDFWKSNWFLGVIAALAVASLSQADLVKSLERKAHDRGVRESSRNPSERVAIDTPAIANLGRRSWVSDPHAQLIQKQAAAQAQASGMAVFSLAPHIDPGMRCVNKRGELCSLLGSAGKEQSAAFYPAPPNRVVAILHQVLPRTSQERYRSGQEMAHAIRERTGSMSIVDTAL